MGEAWGVEVGRRWSLSGGGSLASCSPSRAGVSVADFAGEPAELRGDGLDREGAVLVRVDRGRVSVADVVGDVLAELCPGGWREMGCRGVASRVSGRRLRGCGAVRGCVELAGSGGRRGSRRRRCGASQDGRGRGVYRVWHRNQSLRVGGEGEDLGCCGRPIRSALSGGGHQRSPGLGHVVTAVAVHPVGRQYRHIENAVAARQSRGYGTVGAPRDRGYVWPTGRWMGMCG